MARDAFVAIFRIGGIIKPIEDWSILFCTDGNYVLASSTSHVWIIDVGINYKRGGASEVDVELVSIREAAQRCRVQNLIPNNIIEQRYIGRFARFEWTTISPLVVSAKPISTTSLTLRGNNLKYHARPSNQHPTRLF